MLHPRRSLCFVYNWVCDCSGLARQLMSRVFVFGFSPVGRALTRWGSSGCLLPRSFAAWLLWWLEGEVSGGDGRSSADWPLHLRPARHQQPRGLSHSTLPACVYREGHRGVRTLHLVTVVVSRKRRKSSVVGAVSFAPVAPGAGGVASSSVCTVRLVSMLCPTCCFQATL